MIVERYLEDYEIGTTWKTFGMDNHRNRPSGSRRTHWRLFPAPCRCRMVCDPGTSVSGSHMGRWCLPSE